jgi:BirA family biotin operon repressor/biotin-[acetyl-CoA-carboxylase] ligase
VASAGLIGRRGADVARRRRLLGLPPWNLRVLPVCASTETELTQWLQHKAWEGPQPRAVIARHQIRAQGQWGRVWQAPPGGVWISAALPWPPMAAAPGLLGLAVALALAERIEREGVPIRIKWPNDLLIGDRKLAGVLPRMVHRGGRLRLARVGVGLNVINPVPAGAVALRQVLARGRCRPRVWTTEVLRCLDRACGTTLAPQALMRAVEARLWQRQVRDPATGEPWRITGLGADGSLQLQQGTRTTSWTRWADTREQGL